jgi:hypothetical protein
VKQGDDAFTREVGDASATHQADDASKPIYKEIKNIEGATPDATMDATQNATIKAEKASHESGATSEPINIKIKNVKRNSAITSNVVKLKGVKLIL